MMFIILKKYIKHTLLNNDIAKEFCSDITLKLILTARDSVGQTAYILSKLQNNSVHHAIGFISKGDSNVKFILF